MRRRWSALAVAAALSMGLAGLATGASPASASSPPAQVNDYNCTPNAAHPYPVVLVHGTLESSAQWDNFWPTLASRGYCVFKIDYASTQDIAKSAGELKTFIAKVLSSTKAAKVDIVGHSQGGMMPRYYLKNLGGGPLTDKLVGLAPSNYGTSLQGLSTLVGAPIDSETSGLGALLFSIAPSLIQQIAGGPFLTALNAGGDTVPGVQYLVIATKSDEIVTPYTGTFLKGAGALNVTIQDICPNDNAGHITLANGDSNAWQVVYDFLDPASYKPVTCTAVGISV